MNITCFGDSNKSLEPLHIFLQHDDITLAFLFHLSDLLAPCVKTLPEMQAAKYPDKAKDWHAY